MDLALLALVTQYEPGILQKTFPTCNPLAQLVSPQLEVRVPRLRRLQPCSLLSETRLLNNCGTRTVPLFLIA
jgi:hypothetical protein